MANKLGKFLLGLTAAGAAGAGVYYLLKKKYETEPEDEFDDDFEDEDFELDDDLGEVAERGYVSLTPSSDVPKEERPEEADAEVKDLDATPDTEDQTDKTEEQEVKEAE